LAKSDQNSLSPFFLLIQGSYDFPTILEAVREKWGGIYGKDWFQEEKECFAECSPVLEAAVLVDERRRDMSDFIHKPDPGRSALEWVQELGPLNDVQKAWAQGLGWSAGQNRGLKYLSTGEWRKTMLIRSLASDYLLWDGPLEGLDRASKAFVQDNWTALEEKAGALVLVHHRRELPKDRKYWLWDGQGILEPQGNEEASSVAAGHALDLSHSLEGREQEDWTVVADFPGVKVEYQDGTVVLRDFRWRFRRGEKWLLQGPNGSGKTTIARMLVGDHSQVFGQGIQLFDRLRGSGESLWDIRSRFGFVSTALMNQFRFAETVSRVILSGFFDTIGLYQPVNHDQKKAHRELMAQFSLLGLRDRNFQRLSLGQKRLVLLLRALIKGPQVLVLDEPTLGLDDQDRELVLTAIAQVAAISDISLLYISHEIDEIVPGLTHSLTLVPQKRGGFSGKCSTLDYN
jgi:molybdate transport system ATP-binding protein